MADKEDYLELIMIIIRIILTTTLTPIEAVRRVALKHGADAEKLYSMLSDRYK